MGEMSPAIQLLDTLLQLGTAGSVAYTAYVLRKVRKELREEVRLEEERTHD